MRKLAWCWPLGIIVSTIAVIFFAIVMPGTPIQPLSVFWFLVFCPGMAWIRLLHLQQLITELTLGIAVGLSIDAIVVGIFLYAHAWFPSAMLIVLAVLTVVGAAIQCYQLLRELQPTMRLKAIMK